MKVRLVLLIVGICFTGPVVGEDARQWTSSEGKKLEAIYQSATEEAVTLKRAADGQTFTLPLSKLSQADQDWIAERRKMPAAPGKPIEGPFAEMITGDWALGEEDGLPYALFGAKELDGEKKYPLVVSLHGRSQNNENGKQLTFFTKEFANPERYAKNPCIIFAPLAYQPWGGEGTGWSNEPGEKALAMIETLIKELPIDEDRVYVAGHSMGGFGTCYFMYTEPKLFAGGVATAGCTGTYSADVLKRQPLWLHHAVDDKVTEVQGSRNLAEALERSKTFKYTEHPTGGHGIARPVFSDDEVHAWLFSQVK